MAESKPEVQIPNLEINIQSPTSPLVSFNIQNFIKNVNIPVDIKTETNAMQTGGGGGGFFGYFKSFFQGVSQQTLQKKKHDTQNKSYLNSLFYSGKPNEIKEVPKEPPADPVVEPPTDPVVEQPVEPVVEPPADPVVEPPAEPVVEPPAEPVVEPPAAPVVEPPAEPVVEPPAEPVVEPPVEPVVEPPAEPVVEVPTESGELEEEAESPDNLEITKIILTTSENPEIVLKNSLKGTKLFYLAERNDLPSQWV